MAFPQWTRTEAQESSDTDVHTIPFPDTADGNLLILLGAMDSQPDTIGVPSGGGTWEEIWTDNRAGGGGASSICYGLKCDGTETGDITVTCTGTLKDQSSAWHLIQIWDWGGTISTDVDVSGSATGVDGFPNPGSVTAGGGAADNLWIPMMGCGADDATVSAYPSDSTDGDYQVSGNTTAGAGATVGTCFREYSSTDTWNAGAFTVSTAQYWMARTVVVAPGSSGSDPGAGGGGTTTVSLEMAVQQQMTAAAALQVVVSETRTVVVSLEQAVQEARTATAALQLAVQAEQTDSVALEMAVAAAQSAIASLSMFVTEAGVSTALVSLEMAVQEAMAVSVALETAVQSEETTQAALELMVAQTQTATAALELMVALANSAVASLEMLVQEGKTATVALSMSVTAVGIFSPAASRTRTLAARDRSHRPPARNRRH